MSAFQDLSDPPFLNMTLVGAMEEFTTIQAPPFLSKPANKLTSSEVMAGGVFNYLQGIAKTVVSLNKLVQSGLLSLTPPTKSTPNNGYFLIKNFLTEFSMNGSAFAQFYQLNFNDVYDSGRNCRQAYVTSDGLKGPSAYNYQNFIPEQGDWNNNLKQFQDVYNNPENYTITNQEAAPALSITNAMNCIQEVYNLPELSSIIHSNPDVQSLLNNLGSIAYNAQEIFTGTGWNTSP